MKQFRRLLYLQQFLADCMPIYALYALMFVDHGHLSTAQIGLLFVWWAIVALVAEVPTGIVAAVYRNA